MVGAATILICVIFSVLILLVHQSHRKLANINGMIGIIIILVNNVQVGSVHGLLFVYPRVVLTLD